MSDANVEAVLKKIRGREAAGLRKYGVTTERLDLQTINWLRHAQEEAMDLAVYLERLISDIEQNPYDSSALRESLALSAYPYRKKGRRPKKAKP